MANDTVPYLMPDGRYGLNIDTSKSLVAADAGIVQNVVADAITITLPTSAAATVGATFIVRNGGVKATSGAAGTGSNGTALVSVAVGNSSDGFSGNAMTAATNKKLLNTKATSVVGDEVTLVGSGVTSAVAWFTGNVKGIWAREA